MSVIRLMIFYRGKENCCGDVFELIETLVDYHAFEESIISHREELEGKFKHLDDLLRIASHLFFILIFKN